MSRAVGAVALAAVALAGCAADSASDDTLPPVGSAAAVTLTATAASAPTGPVGRGVVRLTVQLSGQREELMLDRATVAVADLDPITLDATCTALDGGEGYVVSIVDVRRLSAGQQFVSASLRATPADGPLNAGEHPARLELGTAEQQFVRFEGVLVLDPTLAAGTFDLAAGDGAVATGTFACAEDLASLPTTTTAPPVVEATEATEGSGGDGGPPSTIVVVTAPPPTVPIATS